ncbi:MAG: type II toxin-antitoxin system HicA family toxin [Gammaproteobacteria bacterium]
MTRLPSLTGPEIIAALWKVGFKLIRIKGGHHVLRHADGRTTTVPVHAGETIGPGLFAKILRDCDITREQCRELL